MLCCRSAWTAMRTHVSLISVLKLLNPFPAMIMIISNGNSEKNLFYIFPCQSSRLVSGDWISQFPKHFSTKTSHGSKIVRQSKHRDSLRVHLLSSYWVVFLRLNQGFYYLKYLGTLKLASAGPEGWKKKRPQRVFSKKHLFSVARRAKVTLRSAKRSLSRY